MQRRVYDALNVLSAMDIIRKDKYNIIYNHYNEHVPTDFGMDWSDSDDNESNPGAKQDDNLNQPGSSQPENQK